MREEVESSNCTFMELKSGSVAFNEYKDGGSNCTFMELKFR